jgi:hypothetical protein
VYEEFVTMKQSFDLDNFESFLSEQADKHRMYANDKVWHNIQQSLHGIDRWPALTFASILTLACIAVVLTITYPNRQLIKEQQLVQKTQSGATDQIIDKAEIPETLDLTKQAVIAPGITPQQPVGFTYSVSPSRAAKPAAGEEAAETLDLQAATTSVEKETSFAETTSNVNAGLNAGDATGGLTGQIIYTNTRQGELIDVMALSTPVQPENKAPGLAPEKVDFNNEPIEKVAEKNFVQTSLDYSPGLPAELRKKQPRWSLQIYATPSISYRYLLEDKKYLDDHSSTNGPLAPYLTHSVNQFVRHKPKMGAEVGAALLYQLTDNFRVKSGLQLNYRQYGIEAYATSQMQPAILTLDRGNGNGVDSIIRYTNISAQNGYRQIELSSSSLQLALPIGFDLRLAQVNKVGFYVAAAGQLTWQLANNSYLISSDFKNYLKQPDLNRRFNINTAVEAFVTFDAGGVTWQAGPQIRYQILPGSADAYPVREHLVDYGMKVGIIKTFK